MPSELSLYIINYGYLAIFLLVLLQAIGIPNPIPVEFVLLFAGYLIYTGLLQLILVLSTAVFADSIGAMIIYSIFYFSGTYILRNKPRWFPVSQKTISKLMVQVEAGGSRSIYLLRLTPFLRGYISVMAGLLQIKPKKYLLIVLISSATWVTICLIAGRLLAPYWTRVEHHFGSVKFLMIIAGIIILVIVLAGYLRKSYTKKNNY